MPNCDCSVEVESREQSRVLWILLAINAFMFAAEIIEGALVHVLDSRLPDLVIGNLIVLVVLRGGIRIIKEARTEREKAILS